MVERNRAGKLVTFGREDNAALLVPNDARTMGGGKVSLRLTSPSLDNAQFVQDFENITTSLLSNAKKGIYLDSLVIDGMSEFDLLFESTFSGGSDKFAKFEALLDSCFAIMQRLDPIELHCNVIVTARVMEKKKAKLNRDDRKSIQGDPDYLDFDYYPSLRGSFRLHFPHYFNIVAYMETELGSLVQEDGTIVKVPKHVLNMVRTGEFYVKNQWEYHWLKAHLPTTLVNPMFDDVQSRIVQLTGRSEPISMLVYGGPGAGKTALGVSSFWDWKEFRYLTKGEE